MIKFNFFFRVWYLQQVNINSSLIANTLKINHTTVWNYLWRKRTLASFDGLKWLQKLD